jgi:hypothetical protein
MRILRIKKDKKTKKQDNVRAGSMNSMNRNVDFEIIKTKEKWGKKKRKQYKQ